MSDERRAGPSGRPDPFSGVTDVGVGADGAYDGASGDCGFACALEQVFERGADLPLAPSPEAGGTGMAVNGLAVGEVVLVGDHVGTAPMKEGSLDGAALRVAADRALARVAVKIPRASLAVGEGRAGVLWALAMFGSCATVAMRWGRCKTMCV